MGSSSFLNNYPPLKISICPIQTHVYKVANPGGSSKFMGEGVLAFATKFVRYFFVFYTFITFFGQVEKK
jgi:hypothetical protein